MTTFVTLVFEKIADKFSAEHGAEGKPHTVDGATATLMGSPSGKPGERLVHDLIDAWLGRRGLALDNFARLDDDSEDLPGGVRLTYSRIEDADGAPAAAGDWLADYTLVVDEYEARLVPVGTLGLPHADDAGPVDAASGDRKR
jgi:hypothetical protein